MCFSHSSAVYWTTMVYEVSGAETSVWHVIFHDADDELAFKVSVAPIGVDVRVSAVREEREDSAHTIFRITHATSLDVQVTLYWV